ANLSSYSVSCTPYVGWLTGALGWRQYSSSSRSMSIE
ncbi:unnamed protein product, partial [Callosobruchus maculatus]